MKRKRGFTLVELLVVMAIIAILASIVLPNVITFIKKARANRALSEIKGIELALSKILADSDRSSLHHLFNPDAVNMYIHQTNYVVQGALTAAQFQRAQSLYTNTFYALLREGRLALQDSHLDIDFGLVLNNSALRKLATNYMDVVQDPWDQMYQIFPGPWRPGTVNNPCIFRTFMRSDAENNLPGSRGGSKSDAYTIDPLSAGTQTLPLPDHETDDPLDFPHNFPASRNKVAFIYSTGANIRSGQMVYQPFSQNRLLDDYLTWFDQDQEAGFMAGGDDINNWDSGRAWERFY